MGTGEKIAHGAAWMLFFKLADRLLGIVSIVILARLLSPSDFGLVALASSFIAGLELLSAFSFDVTLIQKKQTTRAHFDTAWTLNVLFGVASAAILVAISIPLANFYAEPRLVGAILVLALATALQGMENIGTVWFRKEMRFKTEFQFMMGKRAAGFLITLPLAFLLRDYWALIFGTLAMRVFGLALSFLMHSYRPRFSLAARGELVHFSKWLLFNNLLYFLKHKTADLMIGKLSGTRALGLYNLSYEISTLPSTALAAPINRAVYPGYAMESDKREALKRVFLDVNAIIFLLVLPMGVGLAITAEPLVAVLLSSKWEAAVPIVQILAFYGLIESIQSNYGYLFVAVGKPKIITLLTAAYLAFLIPAILILTKIYGVVGAAFATLVVMACFLPIQVIVLVRELRIATHELIAFTWRPTISVMLMSLAVMLVLDRCDYAEVGAVVSLMLAIIVGAAIYCTSVWALWLTASRPPGAEQSVMVKVTEWLSRRL